MTIRARAGAGGVVLRVSGRVRARGRLCAGGAVAWGVVRLRARHEARQEQGDVLCSGRSDAPAQGGGSTQVRIVERTTQVRIVGAAGQLAGAKGRGLAIG